MGQDDKLFEHISDEEFRRRYYRMRTHDARRSCPAVACLMVLLPILLFCLVILSPILFNPFAH